MITFSLTFMTYRNTDRLNLSYKKKKEEKRKDREEMEEEVNMETWKYREQDACWFTVRLSAFVIQSTLEAPK